MFPEIQANLSQLESVLSETNSDIKPLGKTFLFDYKTGQHILKDGKMIECTSDEAVAQWIEKVLRTAVGKYGVYVVDEITDFGIAIYNYIGEKRLHTGYIASELKREITDQLLNHRYIESVENFEAERNGRTLEITFSVRLITGTTIEKGVQIDGL